MRTVIRLSYSNELLLPTFVEPGEVYKILANSVEVNDRISAPDGRYEVKGPFRFTMSQEEEKSFKFPAPGQSVEAVRTMVLLEQLKQKLETWLKAWEDERGPANQHE